MPPTTAHHSGHATDQNDRPSLLHPLGSLTGRKETSHNVDIHQLASLVRRVLGSREILHDTRRVGHDVNLAKLGHDRVKGALNRRLVGDITRESDSFEFTRRSETLGDPVFGEFRGGLLGGSFVEVEDGDLGGAAK